MKLLFTISLLLSSPIIFAQSSDNCTVGAYAVVDRTLMSCQKGIDGVAKFEGHINNSRLSLFLFDNRNNPKIQELLLKFRGISLEDFSRMLDGAIAGYNYTTVIVIPANQPEKLQALKDFVAEYNAIQNYNGMVPIDTAPGAPLPPAPAGSKTSAD